MSRPFVVPREKKHKRHSERNTSVAAGRIAHEIATLPIAFFWTDPSFNRFQEGQQGYTEPLLLVVLQQLQYCQEPPSSTSAPTTLPLPMLLLLLENAKNIRT